MLIYLLMISSLIFSAEKSYVDPAAKKEMAAKNDELIQKVLADPEVSKVYEGCKQNPKIADCIFTALGAEKSKEIIKKYTTGQKGGTKTDHDTTLIETRATKDPAILKLEEYLMKRLQEALYGDAKGEAAKKGKVVDHEAFYQLYKTQLSKNLISLLSAYMIEVNLDTIDSAGCKQADERNRKTVREKNLAKLRLDPQSSADKWGSCVMKIAEVCETVPNDDYTKQNACTVSRGLKDIRQNLIYTDAVLTQIKNSKPTNNDNQNENLDIYVAGSAKDEKSLDHLTGISSGELERSGFATENEAMKKELEEKCQGSSEDPVCKQYLHDEEERKKLDELAAEAELRGKMISDKIQDMNTPEEWKAYLKKEGRSDKEIEVLIADITTLKVQIKTQYDAEKDALIKKMKDQMGIRSSTTGANGGPPTPPSLQKITEDISSRTKNYAQLVQFNNVVSGYLTLDQGRQGNNPGAPPSETFTNVQAVQRELNDTAKDESLGVTIADKRKIEESLKDKKAAKNTGEMDISLKTINSILKYKNSPVETPTPAPP